MRIKAAVAALMALACVALPVGAQQRPAALLPPHPTAKAVIAPATPAPQTTQALTREDLESWLDGYMPFALRRGDIAGAVVVVVKDGQVLLQKGYGYADVAAKKPVDPETTLFRPGSVSKLYTWTALMQLVEAGKVDLDADVNTYLDFKIPPYQGKPITVRNLMTHTTGFEEVIKNLLITDPKALPELGPYLGTHIPDRIFAPGEVPAYSNYGAALAGYIIQRVSGQPFDDYIEQHIFAPLGMTHATFRQPLPDRLKPLMAQGYSVASGPAKPYELVGASPPGGSAISGGDMARFMIAHLQDGEYQGQRILQAATAQKMHGTPLTIISPSLHRMLLGFYETDRNGHRIIAHGGDLRWFHSDLELFPDDHVGLFFSFNSVGRDAAVYPVREALFDEFTDRYFPGPAPQGQVDPAVAKADAARLAGDYDGSRRPQDSFMSLLNLLSQATVTTDKDNHVIASPVTGLDGQPKRFEEIAPLVWREVGGKDRLAAKAADGHVTMWSEDGESPFLVFQPTPGFRNATWLKPALFASIAALLLTALSWPLVALVRWRYGARFALKGMLAVSYRSVRIAALASGLVMTAWLLTLVTMIQNYAFGAGMDPWITTLHLLSIVVFPLAALAAVANAGIAFTQRKGWRSLFAWGWSVVLVLSTLVVLWTGIVFHLIGLGLHY